MGKLKSLLKDVVLFDMTNLLNYPIRTGIQRVTHQLALHWPDDRPLLPFRHIGPDRIFILSPEILIHTERHFSSGDDLIQRAASYHHGNSLSYGEGFHRMMAMSRQPLLEFDAVIAAQEARAVLSIELSMDIDFYGRLADAVPEKVYVLNYDYILWLNPEFNSEVDWTAGDNFSEYVSILRKFDNKSFISTDTRDKYYRYIDHKKRGKCPVIMPGTDGLGVMRRTDVGSEATFVVIGTIEPRKQHLKILRAIERVQAEGIDVSLTVIGKMGWLTSEDRQEFERIVQGNDKIEWLDSPSDDQLIARLSKARASIFFSRTEGFGGPPVESLSLGVPLIVSDTTPSILDLPNRGQIRVGPDDDEGLRAAIRFFADPANARLKQAEIEDLNLPTWRNFIVGISDWIDQSAPIQGSAFTMRGRIEALSLGKLIATNAPLKQVLSELFRIVLLREPGYGEIAGWLDYAEADELDCYGLVASFLVKASQKKPEAMSLLSSILASGEGPVVSEAVDSVTDAILEKAEHLLLLASNRRVAERIYSDLHERPASPEEIANMTEALNAGLLRSECIITALSSEEFKARNLGVAFNDTMRARLVAKAPYELVARLKGSTDHVFVNAAYRLLLRRNPDPEGLTNYVTQLANGRTRKVVVLDILLSVEARYAGLDINVVNSIIQLIAHMRDDDPSPLPTIVEDAGSFMDMSASQILSLARVQPLQFRSVAGEVLHGPRPYSATIDGKKAHLEIDRLKTLIAIVETLPLHNLGGIDVPVRLTAFIRVLEARLSLEEPNDHVFVDDAYRLMLGRTPDPCGRSHYLARLEQGVTRLELLLDLLKSDEAANRDGPETVRWMSAHLAGARQLEPIR